MRGKSSITTEFDPTLEDLKNNEKTTKLTSVKSRGGNINLHPLIKKMINAERAEL